MPSQKPEPARKGNRRILPKRQSSPHGLIRRRHYDANTENSAALHFPVPAGAMTQGEQFTRGFNHAPETKQKNRMPGLLRKKRRFIRIMRKERTSGWTIPPKSNPESRATEDTSHRCAPVFE